MLGMLRYLYGKGAADPMILLKIYWVLCHIRMAKMIIYFTNSLNHKDSSGTEE